MANPRQRRKARSSSHKPISHSKRAKKLLKKTPPVRGPKILQDAWDKHKTVRQNYAALGLVSNLNPLASGGMEQEIIPVADDGDMVTEATPAGSRSANSDILVSAIPKGYGKIVRDAEGNVIRVELADDDEEESQAVDNEEMKDPEVDPRVLSDWVQDLGGSGASGAKARTKGGVDVVRALERLSSLQSSQVRFTSDGEVAYLARLTKKYGEDVESMARDRRLNTEQRTAGELRRAIRKAGGVGKLNEVG